MRERNCAAFSRCGSIRMIFSSVTLRTDPEMLIAPTAVDTTAAGDSFIGGLCCAIAADAPMDKAVRYATTVSSITVTRHGALPSLPTKAEADAAFERIFGGAAKHTD